MPSVMISYSRRNREIALEVDAQLEAADHDVWIDREIEPAADWKERIAQAIDECSTVVFLLSPDSLTSDVCAWEVDHAVAAGKRIVPVVVVEPGEIAVPPALASRNYVFLTAAHDWDVGFAGLTEAIEVDLEWADYHARILTRSLEWDRAGRRDRSMLRGEDLKEAEREFAEARDVAQSQPTALQLQYLQACRAMAAKRLRRLIGAGIVAMIAIAGLAVVALILRSQAATERDRANEEAAISRSGELAALATTTNDPYEAAILAIEADQIRSTTSSRGAVVRATERLDVLPANRRYGRLLGHASFAWAVDVSVASNRVVSVGLDGEVLAWDLTTGDVVDASYSLSDEPVAIEFSPDGSHVAIVDARGLLHLLDPSDLGEIEPPGQLEVAGTSVRFYDDGFIGIGGAQGAIEFWDLERWESDGLIDYEVIEGLWAVDVSPDGRYLAGGTQFGEVAVWDLDTGGLVGDPIVAHQSIIYSVSWSADSTLVATTSLDRTVAIVDAETVTLMRSLNGHEEGVLWVDWSPRDGRLATTGFDGTVRLWDASSGAPYGIALPAHTNSVSMVAWADDGDVIASASDDRSIMVWDVEPADAVTGSLGTGGFVREVAWNGDSFWAADDNGRLTNYSLDGTVLDEIDVGEAPIVSAGIAPDGNRIAALDQRGTLSVGDVNGDIVDATELGSNVDDDLIDRVRPGAVAWSPDGSTVAAGLDDGVWLWRPGDDPVRLSTPADGWIFTISWSPDGTQLAVGGDDDLVHVWSVDDDEASTAPLTFHIDDVYDVTWSPDGSVLASGSKDKSVRLWSSETWEPMGIDLRGHRGWILDVDWSPDGATIATSSPDRTVRLWDATTGSSLGDPIEGYTGFVTSIDWNSAGDRLVAGDDFGNIRVYRAVPTGELCRWAVGGLSELDLAGLDLGDVERSCTPERVPEDATPALPAARRR